MSGFGFAIDWDLSGAQTNLVLQGDRTFHVVGAVNVIGSTTIEGGTVVKLTNSPLATIVTSNVVCKTRPFAPAIITAKDDDSVGTRLQGSTGIPSGYYGNIALNLFAADIGQELSYVHFRYLSNAVAGLVVTLRNSQIINCKNGFAPESLFGSLYNVLVYRVNTLFSATPGQSGVDSTVLEHVTSHFCTNLMGDTTAMIFMTNCLLVCTTNWHCTYTYTNQCAVLNSDDGVFQTVGGGRHYLADASPYRGIGTTFCVDTNLLNDIKEKTTWPPKYLCWSPLSTTTNVLLYPHVPRDPGTAPDLGFHYPALDYEMGFVWATNGITVTIVPGTVIGTFGTNTGTYGLGICDGARLVSGRATFFL